MTPNVIPAFIVPFGQAKLALADRLNAELRDLFLACESEGERYRNPHPTMRFSARLYESRFDLFKWPQPCIAKLREFCLTQLYRFVADLTQRGENAPPLTVHADAWFHLTRRGGHFGIHNHPMATWSGVYCVDPAGSDADPALGGRLSFPHPLASAAMFRDPTVNALKLPYGYSTLEYRLEAGDLVIFPSWLMHHVTPYYGEGVRVTVAFNAWFSQS
ncbi:MAG: hypothetical protein IRZ06_12405 [Nevskia sp.]|nr:hypothetical protein [Nevskia sp.]